MTTQRVVSTSYYYFVSYVCINPGGSTMFGNCDATLPAPLTNLSAIRELEELFRRQYNAIEVNILGFHTLDRA